MKKKFIKFAIVGAIAIIGTVGYNFTVNQDDANFQFSMDNIDALAQGEATSNRFKCYSIFTGDGNSISCATCQETAGTPPWYHNGSYCTR